MNEVHFGWFLLVLDIVGGYLTYFVPGHPLFNMPVTQGGILFTVIAIVALALITTGKHQHKEQR